MQDNNEEKNQQVPFMKEIFQHAQLVLAGLGTAPASFEVAWGFMRQFPYHLRAVKVNYGPAPLAWWGGVEPLTEFWDIMHDFFGRPYFNRLWIIQEVVLAQKVSILCGEFFINWWELILIVEAIHSDRNFATRGWAHPYTLQEIDQGCSNINMMELLREWRRIQYEPDASYLTVLSQSRQVSDMRDKVYGILGMVKKQIQDLINVDVSKTITEVYIDFSKALYYSSEYPRLELLNFAGVSNSSIEDLPSWCLDFRSAPKARLPHTKFGAGKSLDRIHTANLLVSKSDPVIEVSGWEADLVAQVVDHPKNERRPGELAMGFLNIPMGEATWRWDEECLQIAKTTLNSPDGIPEAYLRTITADRNLGRYTVTDYKEWKQAVFENWQALINEGKWGHPESLRLTAFGNDVGGVCAARKFFSTVSGRIGIGPISMQPGDSICILFQSNTPFVIRKNSESGRYKLQGDAYLFGLMYGEFWKVPKGPEAKEIRFVID